MTRTNIVYFRKTGILLAIASIMIGGLVLFNHNRLTLTHQHPYYAQSYLDIARYKVENLLGDIAGKPAQAGTTPAYATSVPVLVYHGIRPTNQGENISLANFDSQMIALKRAGWQTVSIGDYYDFMRHGKKLPAKSFLMTFDDGRKDSYYPVEPMLAALGFRATMFVITESSFNPVENKFYLDKSELTIMKNNGHWDLQPHAAFGHYLYAVDAKGTQGHFFDNKLWLADKNRLETDQEFSDRTLGDLELAKSMMQQQLGSSGIAFAFPFNEFGGASLNYPGAEAALMANVAKVYPIAFYQIWPNKGDTQNYPEDPSFLMKRILIDSSLNAPKLLNVLSASSSKSLPYTNELTSSQGEWLSTWGQLTFGQTGMTISASTQDNGSAVFLDGGGAWRNYSVSANLKLQAGQWARILGRFHDDTDYASCTYSDHSMIMEETVNGVTHTLQEVDETVPVGNFQAQLLVKGAQMQCQVNGQTVTTSNELSPSLAYGGLGFSSFGPGKNNSKLQISHLDAEPLP